MWWENQVDSSLSRKRVHDFTPVILKYCDRINLWGLRGPKRLQNLRKPWKITKEEWGSVYQNDSYTISLATSGNLHLELLAKLSPSPPSLTCESPVEFRMWFWVSTLLKANPLGRTCGIDKHLLTCTRVHVAHLSINFLLDLFQLLFPSSCLSTSISNPCKWCTFESTGWWVELLIPSSKPRPDRKWVESAACSPGVTGHLIEKVSKERDLEPCLRLLTKMLISAGHCLGQQLLPSVFHHIWTFLWHFWNGVAHIFGQVRIFFFISITLFFTRNICS